MQRTFFKKLKRILCQVGIHSYYYFLCLPKTGHIQQMHNNSSTGYTQQNSGNPWGGCKGNEQNASRGILSQKVATGSTVPYDIVEESPSNLCDSFIASDCGRMS